MARSPRRDRASNQSTRAAGPSIAPAAETHRWHVRRRDSWMPAWLRRHLEPPIPNLAAAADVGIKEGLREAREWWGVGFPDFEGYGGERGLWTGL